MWTINEKIGKSWDEFVIRAQSNKHFSAWARRQRADNMKAIQSATDILQTTFNARIHAADWFDKENRLQADYVRNLKTQVLQKLISRIRSGPGEWTAEDLLLFPAAGWAVTVDEIYSTVTSVSAAYVDVLRLGQGVLVERSVKGYFKDGLRLLQILPIAAMARGMKSAYLSARLRLAMRIPGQPPTNFECVTNSAARAMAMLYGKLFAPVMDLWRAAGIQPPMGHPAQIGLYFHQIVPPLEAVGATVTKTAAPTLGEVMAAAERNPNSAVMFAVQGSNYCHAMLASSVEGKVLVYDTTGQVYRSWAELLRAYPKAVSWGEMLLIRGTMLMSALDVAVKAGNLSHLLAFEIKYLPLTTPITLLTAHKYTDEVALAKQQKPSGSQYHEQQRQSDKAKPTAERIGGEPGWHDPAPRPPDFAP